MCDISNQTSCRICLDENSRLVSILEDYTIQLHIKSCLAMTVSPDDDLPKAACEPCVSQLRDFYNFQLKAYFSQQWLESSEKPRKTTENKMPVQPLPDSEYNSDSLLEFLNSTENIEEYLNNLGKEDIPSIVNMLDRNNENSLDSIIRITSNTKTIKIPSPKKKDTVGVSNLKMEIDILDSDMEIVKEILLKENEPKVNSMTTKYPLTCFACKTKFDTYNKLSQHMTICETASRTCIYCSTLFDSKRKMLQHRITHNQLRPFSCECGVECRNKETLLRHFYTCHMDYVASLGCVYKCKQCGETFKERLQLYKHVKKHIIKAEERICDICGLTFSDDVTLSRHQKEHGSAYRCKQCNFISANYREVFKHVQNHGLNENLKKYLCESCGQSFTSQHRLATHSERQHKGTQNQCFKETKVLKRRISTHEGSMMCDKCGQYVISSNIDSHFCT